jgi:hypothetical protein
VQRRAGKQQARHHRAEAGSEHRLPQGQPAEQRRQHERRLGRDPGIIAAGPPVGQRRQGDDAAGHHRQQKLAAHRQADRSGESGHGKGAQPGRAALRALPLAAFALDANQQADAEGHRKPDQQAAIEGHRRRPSTDARTRRRDPLETT